jgi:hypothetical protein
MTRRALVIVAAAGALIPAAIAATSAVILASPGPTPFAACTADQADAQQAAGSILFPNAEVEPRADVNPTDRSNIVGAYQQDRWSDGGARGLVTSVSKNGGSSWHRVTVPGITKCSGGAYDRASDPWLSFAPNGDLYEISLSFDVFDSLDAILVSKSTNGGDTWSSPTPIVAEDTNGLDKQSITADPFDARFAYAAWDIFVSPPKHPHHDRKGKHADDFIQPTYFSRTTDGGQTWEQPSVLYNPGVNRGTIGSIINVLPNGDLVDGLLTFSARKNGSTEVSVIRSRDRGAKWKKPVVVAAVDTAYSNSGPTDPDNGQPIRGGELPDFTVDPASGALYAVWEDDVPIAGVGSIFFSQSTDGGSTWSQPVKINQTPTTIPAGNQTAFTPTVKVAANGTVGVTYYDLRNNTAAPGLPTDAWLVRCSGACTNASSWRETHVAGPFDEEQAPFALGYFLGDYEGMVTLGNTFAPFFVQAVSRAAGNPTDAFFTRVP